MIRFYELPGQLVRVRYLYVPPRDDPQSVRTNRIGVRLQ